MHYAYHLAYQIEASVWRKELVPSFVKGQMNLDGDGQQNWTETDTRTAQPPTRTAQFVKGGHRICPAAATSRRHEN